MKALLDLTRTEQVEAWFSEHLTDLTDRFDPLSDCREAYAVAEVRFANWKWLDLVSIDRFGKHAGWNAWVTVRTHFGQLPQSALVRALAHCGIEAFGFGRGDHQILFTMLIPARALPALASMQNLLGTEIAASELP